MSTGQAIALAGYWRCKKLFSGHGC